MVGVEKVNLRPTQKTVTRQVPVVRTVQVPVEYEVTRIVEQPVSLEIEKTVHRFQEVPQEKMITKNALVERVTQVANRVTRDIVIDVNTRTDNVRTVERLIENPIQVDTVL